MPVKIINNVVKEEYDLDMSEPPQDHLEWATENINEDPDTRVERISEFKNLIFSEGKITPHRTDDAYLLRFLRARRFNIERAYKLLTGYLKFRENNESFYQDVNLWTLEQVCGDNVVSVLPVRDQEGVRTTIINIGNWDTSKFAVEEILKTTLALLEMAVLEPRTQILGGSIIYDFQNLSMSHVWYMTPSIASKIIDLMGVSFPIRLRHVHIVNEGWLFNTIYAFFKPLLTQSMRDKLHFHGSDMSSLHEYIHPEFLPEIYGGTGPEITFNKWIDTLGKNELNINEMKTLGYIIYPTKKEWLEKQNEYQSSGAVN